MSKSVGKIFEGLFGVLTSLSFGIIGFFWQFKAGKIFLIIISLAIYGGFSKGVIQGWIKQLVMSTLK